MTNVPDDPKPPAVVELKVATKTDYPTRDYNSSMMSCWRCDMGMFNVMHFAKEDEVLLQCCCCGALQDVAVAWEVDKAAIKE